MLHVTSGGSSAFTVSAAARGRGSCVHCACVCVSFQATTKRSPSRSPTRTEASASVTSTPITFGRSPAKPPTVPKSTPKLPLSSTLPRRLPPTHAKRSSVPNLRNIADDSGIVPWPDDDSLAVLDEQIAGETAIASKFVFSSYSATKIARARYVCVVF